MSETPRRGRPRDAEADQRILVATRELLLANGYLGLSVDEVAERSAVAKTTLYRRWPTKDHLVVAVLAEMLNEDPVPDSGEIEADLARYIGIIATSLNELRRIGRPAAAGERSAGLLAELVAAVSRHADLAEGIHAAFARRKVSVLAVLRKAIERGELRADLDPAVLLDQLAGPIYYRLLVTGDPVDQPYVRALIVAALRGARPA